MWNTSVREQLAYWPAEESEKFSQKLFSLLELRSDGLMNAISATQLRFACLLRFPPCRASSSILLSAFNLPIGFAPLCEGHSRIPVELRQRLGP